MAEWSNAPDSKSGLRATVTGVQIPLSPPKKSDFVIVYCIDLKML